MPISINNTTLTFNNGTTMTTAATGTVSSVATGNGLQGGTITTSGTLSIACPTHNTVGSYCMAGGDLNQASSGLSFGGNYAAGSGTNQLRTTCVTDEGSGACYIRSFAAISGTWKWMSPQPINNGNAWAGLACRVS